MRAVRMLREVKMPKDKYILNEKFRLNEDENISDAGVDYPKSDSVEGQAAAILSKKAIEKTLQLLISDEAKKYIAKISNTYADIMNDIDAHSGKLSLAGAKCFINFLKSSEIEEINEMVKKAVAIVTANEDSKNTTIYSDFASTYFNLIDLIASHVSTYASFNKLKSFQYLFNAMLTEQAIKKLLSDYVDFGAGDNNQSLFLTSKKDKAAIKNSVDLKVTKAFSIKVEDNIVIQAFFDKSSEKIIQRAHKLDINTQTKIINFTPGDTIEVKTYFDNGSQAANIKKTRSNNRLFSNQAHDARFLITYNITEKLLCLGFYATNTDSTENANICISKIISAGPQPENLSTAINGKLITLEEPLIKINSNSLIYKGTEKFICTLEEYKE